MKIDTGDKVHHGPSGENWLVAYVRGDRLAWCGWPEGEAELGHCTLISKATDAEREGLLIAMASGDGSRASYAKHRLADARSAGTDK